MNNLRQAAQQALEALNIATLGTLTGKWKRGEEAMQALRAALAEQCKCKDRPAAECPGEWEPGCDLGANEEHAVMLLMYAAPEAPTRVEKWPVSSDPLTQLQLAAVLAAAEAPQPKAEQQEPPEVKQIAEALRQVGLTLIRTGTGFRVADLGCIEAQTTPQPRVEPLTIDEISNIAMQSGAYDEQLLAFARAIEAAHGITETPQPRPEVELSDGEITHMAAQALLYEENLPQGFDAAVRSFARAVIAAYKVKQGEMK